MTKKVIGYETCIGATIEMLDRSVNMAIRQSNAEPFGSPYTVTDKNGKVTYHQAVILREH